MTDEIEETAPTSGKRPRVFTKDGLSPQHRRFINEFPKDLNAAKAAERAGFGKANAKKTGYSLLRRPAIVAAIQKRLHKEDLGGEKLVHGLGQIAFADKPSFYDWSENENGEIRAAPKHPNELTDDQKLAVKDFKIVDGVLVGYEFNESQKAINELSRFARYGLHAAVSPKHLHLHGGYAKQLEGLTERELDERAEVIIRRRRELTARAGSDPGGEAPQGGKQTPLLLPGEGAAAEGTVPEAPGVLPGGSDS